eukprot:scaffold2114_cov253-Pinguiococcus_pyrenoidosus.AAC.11
MYLEEALATACNNTQASSRTEPAAPASCAFPRFLNPGSQDQGSLELRLFLRRHGDVVVDSARSLQRLSPLREPPSDSEQFDLEEQVELTEEKPTEPQQIGLSASCYPPNEEVLAAVLEAENHAEGGRARSQKQQRHADGLAHEQRSAPEEVSLLTGPLVDEAWACLQIHQQRRDCHTRDRDEKQREAIHRSQCVRLGIFLVLSADSGPTNDRIRHAGAEQRNEQHFNLEHDP